MLDRYGQGTLSAPVDFGVLDTRRSKENHRRPARPRLRYDIEQSAHLRWIDPSPSAVQTAPRPPL